MVLVRALSKDTPTYIWLVKAELCGYLYCQEAEVPGLVLADHTPG